MQRVNQSTRKIVEVARERADEFRIPEVAIVGLDMSVKRKDIESATQLSYREEIGVPTHIEIESQAVRVEGDGSQVVDLVLSFVGAVRADKHEVRITKL